jgi:hypothetical protein
VAQSEGNTFIKAAVIAMLEGSLSEIFKDHSFMMENRGRKRLSTLTIQQYSDESLFGYGDVDFGKGGDTLQEQQRGLILPLLERAIRENVSAKTIVEIGTGNGDVLKYLADKYPDRHFIGVDFSVANARRQYGRIPAIEFVKGYALDLLSEGSLKGDIVFGSSTFVFFTPLELAQYISLFKSTGFKEVILNEPTWGNYVQENNSQVVSRHLEGNMWYHNFCGYLVANGYQVTDLDFSHYKHPLSTRPDIFIALIRATQPAA